MNAKAKNPLRVAVVLISCLSSIQSRAAWVDDWFSNASVTGPGSYNNQQRGFYQAGGFQARINNTNDFLVTASLPKLKSGCGGVDLFMGGFSFLDEDYLVKKFQGMIQAAPAVAFDIALKVMSQNLSDSMSKMEAATDWLNNLQLNDCAMTKRVVTEVGKDHPDVMGAVYNEMTSGVSLDQALSKNYQQEQEKIKANGGNSTRDLKGKIAGCPTDFKNIVAPGSMIDNAVAQIGMAGYADIVRGYIGDVEIRAGATDNIPVVADIARCPGNDTISLDDMLSGKAMAKANVASGGACYKDSTKGVRDIVRTNLENISNQMVAKGSLSAAQIQFIQNSPVPIYSILRKAVAQDNVDMTIEMMTDVVASAYTFRVFDDLYRNADYLFRKVDTISSPAGAGAAGGECDTSLYAPAIAKFQRMHDSLWSYRLDARKSYLSGINEHMMFMDYSKKHQDDELNVSRRQALDVKPN